MKNVAVNAKGFENFVLIVNNKQIQKSQKFEEIV